jgi:hypothetical protein
MTVARRLAAVGLVGVVLCGALGTSASGRSPGQVQRATVLRGELSQLHASLKLAVVRVNSTPKGRGSLSMRHINTVIASNKLAFIVRIRNEGGKRPVTVTVTVSRPNSTLGSLVKRKTLVLRANQLGIVRLGTFAPVLFAERCRIKVSVSGARSREIWTMVYPVIFSLG